MNEVVKGRFTSDSKGCYPILCSQSVFHGGIICCLMRYEHVVWKIKQSTGDHVAVENSVAILMDFNFSLLQSFRFDILDLIVK